MFNGRLFVLLLAATLVTGCGGVAGPTGAPSAKSGPSAEGKKFLLPEEPAGAKGVLEVRKSAQNDEEVVMIGRIGGSQKPFGDRKANFTLVDPSLVPCSERGDDACPTPWDYCCDPKEDLKRATVLVKVVDGGGEVDGQARDLLGIKELQTVVVRGKVAKDEGGKFLILADKLYVK